MTRYPCCEHCAVGHRLKGVPQGDGHRIPCGLRCPGSKPVGANANDAGVVSGA